jgi:hypothetical protein
MATHGIFYLVGSYETDLRNITMEGPCCPPDLVQYYHACYTVINEEDQHGMKETQSYKSIKHNHH